MKRPKKHWRLAYISSTVAIEWVLIRSSHLVSSDNQNLMSAIVLFFPFLALLGGLLLFDKANAGKHAHERRVDGVNPKFALIAIAVAAGFFLVGWNWANHYANDQADLKAQLAKAQSGKEFVQQQTDITQFCDEQPRGNCSIAWGEHLDELGYQDYLLQKQEDADTAKVDFCAQLAEQGQKC